MLKYSSTDCAFGSQGYSVPYEECLGCNSFQDLNGQDDNGANTLPAWAIVLIVFASLFFCFCCLGLVALAFFGAAQVIACICCRHTTNKTSTQLAQQHSPMSPVRVYIQCRMYHVFVQCSILLSSALGITHSPHH